MGNVLGIGCVFFKSRDPKALVGCYCENLGLPIEPQQTNEAFSSVAAGEQTVSSESPAETFDFGLGPLPFMINYRGRNLDTMLAQLRAAGGRWTTELKITNLADSAGQPN